MSVYVGFEIGKVRKHPEYTSEYYCGGCGWPVSDHDSYCSECGGAFRKEDATERTCKMVIDGNKHSNWFSCSECKCPMNPGDSYCSCCGAKVVE